MGWPVVDVPSGGIPVSISDNAFGTPIDISDSSFGTPVTFIDSGGLPVLLGSGLPAPPSGFVYLLGADGAYLKGADGAYLLGVAP